MDEQVLAMVHSITGGMFFTLCFVFVMLVRRSSRTLQANSSDSSFSLTTFGLAVLLPFVVMAQYTLGGFFRHLGQMLHEHVIGAIVVSLVVCIVAPVLLLSNLPSLRMRGKWLSAALLIQVGLGLGSWMTKLGFPAFGLVATMNSTSQNIVCSMHTVGGMFLLASATAATVELCLCTSEGRVAGVTEAFSSSGLKSSKGGAA